MPVEFKLQDLAKIALGAPELTDVNIAVLHSLIDILLKKFNCQNETITLGAYEAKHLETNLKSSSTSPLAFNDENIEIVTNKFENLENLEEQISKLETKLENHLKQVQHSSNIVKTKVNWSNWESYGDEDLCGICDADNNVACKLLQNTDFLKKLLRRISSPMVERMFYFEDKLERLHEEFLKFIKRSEEQYLKVQLLEKCTSEIEVLSKKINENHCQFISTMEEIQDMLDAKLDKIHIPALKKYIRDQFQHIEQNINALQAKNQCPKAAGVIMEGLCCLSCGATKVCSEVGVQPAAMLPDMKTLQKSGLVTKYSGCSGQGIKQNQLQSSVKLLNLAKKYDEDGVPTHNISKCGAAGQDVDLLEGFNGNLYRKG